jgi:hypothetical protein
MPESSCPFPSKVNASRAGSALPLKALSSLIFPQLQEDLEVLPEGHPAKLAG